MIVSYQERSASFDPRTLAFEPISTIEEAAGMVDALHHVPPNSIVGGSRAAGERKVALLETWPLARPACTERRQLLQSRLRLLLCAGGRLWRPAGKDDL